MTLKDRILPFLTTFTQLTEKLKNILTEPRWALQPQVTQWFPWIGLFVVQAFSLDPCRRPIEVLTSLHPCGRFSKIPNSQIHKVEKWKFLRKFLWKNFFVISHEHKVRFFVVIKPQKNLHTYKILSHNWSEKSRSLLRNKNF